MRLKSKSADSLAVESVETEPVWVKSITPNGINVSYCPDPRQYKVNDVVVPSVTTVLDVLAKSLAWWGMQQGVQGVLDLWDMGHLSSEIDWLTSKAGLKPGTEPEIVELLKEHKLTTNDRRDDAGTRGTDVHTALEQWCNTSWMPASKDFPEDQQGYVTGLAEFLLQIDGDPVYTEIMVGSAIHGFAGRYDLALKIDKPVEIRRTPKKRMQTINPGVYMIDLKTSKRVFPETNFRQLAAYEAASVECGYEPTDGQFVLRVTADGSYELVPSTADFEDFLAVLEVWHSNKRLG